MPNRESLHELIDALPESCARIDRASSLYRTIKLGRQSRPMTWRRCANGSTNFLESAAKNWADRTGTGFVSALIGGSRFKPDGDGMASMSTSEGETLVTLERFTSFGVTDWKSRSGSASQRTKSHWSTLNRLKGQKGKRPATK